MWSWQSGSGLSPFGQVNLAKCEMSFLAKTQNNKREFGKIAEQMVFHTPLCNEA
jgi:hypothetical protein